MPNLAIFKSTFVDTLRAGAAKNLTRYMADPLWVTTVGAKADRDLPTSMVLRESLDLIVPDAGASVQDRAAKDLDNAIRAHKALPELTRLQARDPRLWTRLTHLDLWPYMRRRWPIEYYQKRDGDKVAAGRVLERYFVPQSQSRS